MRGFNEKRYRNHRNEKNTIKTLQKEYQNNVSSVMQQNHQIKARTHKTRSVFTKNRTIKTRRINKKDIKTTDSKGIKQFIKAPKKDRKVSVRIPSQNKNVAKQYAIQSYEEIKRICFCYETGCHEIIKLCKEDKQSNNFSIKEDDRKC